MDLLAAFFFSANVLNMLKNRSEENGEVSQNYINIALRASGVGAFLLTAVYIGFSYLAAFHGNQLELNGKEQLLGALTMKIAGPHAGFIVCITIALACLTTAIALISAFTDFIQTEELKEKISYEMTLVGGLLLTFFISTFQFTGISAVLGPILEICYPGLIVLTFLNIAFRLKNFKMIKLPVFSVFTLSTYFYFF